MLGYDTAPRGGRLLVNETEAAQVRDIFDLYLEKRALEPTLLEIAGRGWTTKSWVTRQDRMHRGGAFRADSLWRLLTNRLYIGLVREAEQDYPGEHTAIVDRARWEEAQRLVRSPAKERARTRARAVDGWLCGVLRCGACGARMWVARGGRRSRRYRYYVCPAAGRASDDKQPGCARSLPADEFEQIVTTEVGRVCGEQPGDLREIVEAVRYTDSTGEVRIRLKDATELTLAIRRGRARHGRIVLQRVEACTPVPASAVSGRVPRISRLVALAIRLDRMLASGSVRNIAELARVGHVTTARATQIVNLTYLPPDLQERLLFFPLTCSGRDVLNERDLRAIATEPSWSCQRRLFEELLNWRRGTEPASSVPGSASVPDAVDAPGLGALRTNFQPLELRGAADETAHAVGLPAGG